MFLGVNMYYQQQPFYPVPPGAPPTGAPPNREDQLRLYEEQRMREKEEIKRREAEERKRRDFEEQKRRLQSMNVLNPKVGGAGAVAMETLIGFTPSPKSKPKATPTTTLPITTAEQAPPPLTATMAPPTPPVSIKTATTINTTSGKRLLICFIYLLYSWLEVILFGKFSVSIAIRQNKNPPF